MKKGCFLSLLILNFFVAYTQSVGINTDASLPNASAMLDVKSSTKGMLMPRMLQAQRNLIPSPAAGLMVYQTDNTPGYYYYNGSAWVPLTGGGAINYWTASGSNIYNNNSGNVGIGTAAPIYKLTVQTQTNQFGFTHTDGDVTLASYIGVFQGALGGWLGTRTNHPLYFYTNNSAQQMTLLPNGNVGIGTINPTNKLQLTGATPGFADYDFAIGRNAQSMAIYQGPNFTNLASTANFSINPKNGTGNVGINAGNPTNKLQIGSIGAAGYNGNDIAFGNGTQATAVAQTSTASQFASNTDFVFLPRYGTGAGRVGINTNTPRAPLDIAGDAVVNGPGLYVDYAYFALRYSNFQPDAFSGGTTQANYQRVSIFADGRIVASEFNANSDARIKDINGVSNASKDLETINKLLITDYFMKDKVKFGNQQFKKVIAQEVEKVYPQVVSKHTDFIPNVYQLTNKITKAEAGYLLHFNTNHNISKSAKKIQALVEGKGMEQFDIVAIISANEVIVNATEIKGDKIFVYGEEVDDFRTVDYEGLTTLNISATQELSKLVKQQQALLEAQDKKIEDLAAAVKLLQGKSCKENHSTVFTKL